MLYKSSIALQIIQRSTNLSTLYKSIKVAQVFQGSKKSFNAVQIIEHNANHST